MKNIVVIGAGDLGKEIIWLIEDINKVQPTYVVLGFLDDDVMKERNEFAGYRVLGNSARLDKLSSQMPVYAVIAIQDGGIRRKIVESHPEFKNWESIIHPSAVIASTSSIGKGCMIFPYVTISVDSKIGDSELLYIRSTICNGCKIGNYTTMMSGVTVSENAKVGDECFLSAGVYVEPYKQVKDGAKVFMKQR